MAAATDAADPRPEANETEAAPLAGSPRREWPFLVALTLFGMAAVAFACWRLDAQVHQGAFGPITDALFVSPYWDDARFVSDGLMPYRDFPLEYPPLSLPVFLLPAVLPFGGLDYPSYRTAFEVLMTVCVMGFVPIVVTTGVALRANRWQLALGVAIAAASPLLLGPLMISRYDPWPALLTGAATLAAVLGRHRWAFALLALGVLAKVYPVFLVPVFLAWAWRTSGPREAAMALGVGTFVGLAGFAPFAAAGTDALIEPFVRTFNRPLQIESLGASILIGLHNWVGLDPGHVIYTFLSFNLDGDLAGTASTVQSLALGAALLALWVVAALGAVSRARFVVSCAAVLCTTVALAKVLSPQYVIWLVPAIAVLTPVWGLRPLAGLGAVLALTQLYYPGMYARYLLRFDAGATIAILERNLALVALAVCLAWATLRLGVRGPADPRPVVPGSGQAGPGNARPRPRPDPLADRAPAVV